MINYGMIEKVLCTYDCFSVQLISQVIENSVFRHNRILRHTCMYKKPMSARKWNYNNFVQTLYSYLSYIDRLVFFFLLVVILSKLHENPRRKEYIGELVKGGTIF